MNWLRTNSLQVRLATRLGTLIVFITLILASVFLYLSYELAETLNRSDLSELAEELADELDSRGNIENTEELFARGWLNDATRYAIFDRSRRLLSSSDPEFVAVVTERAIVANRTELFRLDNFGTPPQNYLGLMDMENSDAGRVAVVVATPELARQELMNALMQDVVGKVLWIVPLFILVTLLVAIFAIRGGLRPLHSTALQAAAIKPEALSGRLDTRNLPTEVVPLVSAVNSALDRLESGFELQRRFTANAAHELRTPLAIITGAIENMDENGDVVKIRQDVERMNRLVEQLLHVARLDSLKLDTNNVVDLRKITHHILEYMAPLAISMNRNLAISDDGTPVPVYGNTYAIEDAIRNLMENAIFHSNSADTIEVTLRSAGTVSVCDRGTGIPEEDKKHIFDRFWRGRNSSGPGAGLGLSIVHEIMKSHGGTVTVRDNSGGGSCFTLHFRTSE